MGSTAVRSERHRQSRSVPPPVVIRNTKRGAFIGVGAALALAALIAYAPGLRGSFVFDDRTLPFRLSGYGENVWAWLQGVRPVLMFSYWFDFLISGGRDPVSYHAFNLAVHLLNTAVVFAIARALLARIDYAGPRELLSAFAAGLFLLHPIQTEAVTYITGRSDVLSTFFLLAAYAVFLYRGERSISFASAAVIVLLFGLACLTKENAVVLPAALLATDLYSTPGGIKAVMRRNWRLYGLLAACAAAGLVIVWRVLEASPTAGFALRDLHWYEYLFTEWRVVWLYIGLFFLPVHQTIDHDIAISRTPLDHGAVFYLLALGVVVGGAWRYRRKFPLVFFGLVLTLIFLAPTSSFAPIRDLAVERRMYLPMLGFALVAVDLLRFFAPNRERLTYAMAAILGLCTVVCFARNGVWRSETTVWADAVAKSPAKARTRVRYGYALLNSRRCIESAQQFQAASRLAPPTYELMVDWALASECLHNAPDALAKLRSAAALEPRAHAYSQMARIYISMGLFDNAFQALDEAQKIDPNFALTYVYRGVAHSELRQFEGAIDDFQRALQLDRDNQTAQQGLARAEAQLSADRVRTPVAR